MGVIYLLQLFEIPYLLQIGDSDALLYVNAFALLFFSIQMLIMCEGYFFPEIKHKFHDHWIFLPAVLILVPMLLQSVGLIHLPDGWRLWAVGAVSLVFLVFFWRSIKMALRIRNAVRRANEDRYADSDDFPVRFANLIRWVPTLVLILLAIVSTTSPSASKPFSQRIKFSPKHISPATPSSRSWGPTASTSPRLSAVVVIRLSMT